MGKESNEMKMFKTIPAYKDYIWGGDKLKTIYGKKTDVSPLAESWELSCHKDGMTYLSNGMSLEEYIDKNKGFLGTMCPSDELPILIKFIDAQDNLSVQVHPTDEQARKWENQNGKTEMWYVAGAEKDAKITCGFNRDVTEEELKKAIEENTLEELLSVYDSEKGDVFFVEAGTVHAIGKGNLIVEIQQNSNVTYRLYDYNRVGKDGKTRELHIEKGIKASNCKKTMLKNKEGSVLAKCKYFKVTEIKCSGEVELCADETSYHALVVVEGNVKLSDESFSAGETIFIPAGEGNYKLEGNGILLLTTN